LESESTHQDVLRKFMKQKEKGTDQKGRSWTPRKQEKVRKQQREKKKGREKRARTVKIGAAKSKNGQGAKTVCRTWLNTKKKKNTDKGTKTNWQHGS